MPNKQKTLLGENPTIRWLRRLPVPAPLMAGLFTGLILILLSIIPLNLVGCIVIPGVTFLSGWLTAFLEQPPQTKPFIKGFLSGLVCSVVMVVAVITIRDMNFINTTVIFSELLIALSVISVFLCLGSGTLSFYFARAMSASVEVATLQDVPREIREAQTLINVKLPSQDSYNMPSICVVCSRQSGTGVLKIGGSSWAVRRFVALSFPLCDNCQAALQVYRKHEHLTVVILVISLLLFIGSIFIAAAYTFIFIAAMFLFLVTTFILAPALVRGYWIGDPVVRARINLITRSVKIIQYDTGLSGKGGLVLGFLNKEFADLFARSNFVKIS